MNRCSDLDSKSNNLRYVVYTSIFLFHATDDKLVEYHRELTSVLNLQPQAEEKDKGN